MHLYPTKCLAKPHIALLLKLYRLSFTDFALFSFISLRERWLFTSWTPNSSLTKRQHAEFHKQNHSVRWVRNRQPNLFHMKEQMPLKLILDTKIKIWFKISVSKIWKRMRKCSLVETHLFKNHSLDEIRQTKCLHLSIWQNQSVEYRKQS